MTQAPWQKEAAERLQRWAPKNKAWMERGFQRINEVTIETGLIPKMHEQFAQRGVEENWLIFDAFESTTGFPTPGVFTRYIVPLFIDDNEEKLESLEVEPGLFIAEVLGVGGRTLSIQIGLTIWDQLRVGDRLTTLFDITGETGLTQPEWWEHPYEVDDATQSYDLVQGREEKSKILEPRFSKKQLDSALRSLVYGDPHPRLSQLEFMYEKEDDEKLTPLWIGDGPELADAIEKMGTIIDAMLMKG